MKIVVVRRCELTAGLRQNIYQEEGGREGRGRVTPVGGRVGGGARGERGGERIRKTQKHKERNISTIPLLLWLLMKNI